MATAAIQERVATLMALADCPPCRRLCSLFAFRLRYGRHSHGLAVARAPRLSPRGRPTVPSHFGHFKVMQSRPLANLAPIAFAYRPLIVDSSPIVVTARSPHCWARSRADTGPFALVSGGLTTTGRPQREHLVGVSSQLDPMSVRRWLDGREKAKCESDGGNTRAPSHCRTARETGSQ